MEKALSQGQEIAAICDRMGISRDELADRIPLNRETMRKIAKEYQPASERMMNSIRNVEKMAEFFREVPTPQVNLSSPYRFMELETLEKSLTDLTLRFKNVSVHDRKHILGQLRAMLDELEERELRPRPDTSKPPPEIIETPHHGDGTGQGLKRLVKKAGPEKPKTNSALDRATAGLVGKPSSGT